MLKVRKYFLFLAAANGAWQRSRQVIGGVSALCLPLLLYSSASWFWSAAALLLSYLWPGLSIICNRAPQIKVFTVGSPVVVTISAYNNPKSILECAVVAGICVTIELAREIMCLPQEGR